MWCNSFSFIFNAFRANSILLNLSLKSHNFSIRRRMTLFERPNSSLMAFFLTQNPFGLLLEQKLPHCTLYPSDTVAYINVVANRTAVSGSANRWLWIWPILRAVVRENRGFFLKFGKCDLTDFDETLHIQSTLRINNIPAIIDFLAKRLPW